MTRPLPSVGKQPIGRRGGSLGGSDYSEREMSPDELIDD